MIVRRHMRFAADLQRSWKRIVLVSMYATLITAIYRLDVDQTTIPIAIPAMLGTALSILLGFRTSSGYDRWWEARKVWGAIVNDSRTFTRQVLSLFVLPDDGSPSDMAALQKSMVYRQVAWNYILAFTLRGQDPFPHVTATLTAEEIAELRVQNNRPNALLQTQGNRLSDALRAGYLDGFRQAQIDNTLTRLCDHMGKCERIKKTVFPAQYSSLVSLIIWLFFLLLPSALVSSLGWLTIPVALLIAVLFWLVEAMGASLQDPFENAATDTPVLALSRIIEINLRQQLGETELPVPPQPVDGVLM